MAWHLNAQHATVEQVPVPIGYSIFVPQNPNVTFFLPIRLKMAGKGEHTQLNIPSKNYLDFPNSTTKVLCRDTVFPFPLLMLTNNTVNPATMRAEPRDDNNRPTLGGNQ